MKDEEKTNQPTTAPAPTKPTKSKNDSGLLSGIALIVAAIALAFSSANFLLNLTKTTFGNISDGNSLNFTEGSIADVADRVSSSVVSIVTETNNSFYTYSSNAAGTGFIVTEDGIIVTNKHVVEDAKSVSVILDNGTQYDKVQVVGTDPLNDVAILKIKDASDLQAIKLGDSKTINVGEQVIAVGNALGAYQNSVTYGIISGTGRSLTATDSTGQNSETLADMIQTDAAINGGNSGGPLVNAAGEVIGINTAYASESNNIGFAIPISSIKGLLRDVQKTGKVQRAVLGVKYYSLDVASARELKLNDDITAGAYLDKDTKSVVPGGAADKAGIKPGDIILAVNGTEIGAAGSLSTLIGEYSVGDTVKLVVYRDGKAYNTEVTLTAYSE